MDTYDPRHPFDPPPEYRARYDAATRPRCAPALFRDFDFAAQERLAPIGFQTPPVRPEERGMQEIKAAYYAMIELLDDVIGSVLAALDRTGQRDDTSNRAGTSGKIGRRGFDADARGIEVDIRQTRHGQCLRQAAALSRSRR